MDRMGKFRLRTAFLAIIGVGLYYFTKSTPALLIYCFMIIMDEINRMYY